MIVTTLAMVNFATMATGTLNFGLFVIPMGEELEMSRGFIGWSQTARLLAGGSFGFIMGRLLDRHGPRILIPIAALVTGICMIGLSYVQNPWHFLLLFNIMGFMGLSAREHSSLQSRLRNGSLGNAELRWHWQQWA